MSIFLHNLPIHESWKPFFQQEEVISELEWIENTIKDKPFTPATDSVLRFATISLLEVNVIILGMDPYPTTRKDNGTLIATGRSFEVQGATSWFDFEVSPSLKNVVKLIHKVYFDRETGAGIEEVRNDIENGLFPIPSPDKAFDYWERQGVIWLNTAFTCEVGDRSQSGSHLSYWKKFFSLLLNYITKANPNIHYFLWGNDAIKFGKVLKKLQINDNLLFQSKHPCTNGDDGQYARNSKFLMNPCFQETKDIINWTLTS